MMNCSKGCSCKVRGGVLCVTVIRSLSQGVESTLVESIPMWEYGICNMVHKIFFRKVGRSSNNRDGGGWQGRHIVVWWEKKKMT
jgi:hypothetical protein